MGTPGNCVGDPLRDPLFLPAERAAERQRIRNHIALWRSTSGPFEYRYDTINLTIDGRTESVSTQQLVERLDQIVSLALCRGVNSGKPLLSLTYQCRKSLRWLGATPSHPPTNNSAAVDAALSSTAAQQVIKHDSFHFRAPRRSFKPSRRPRQPGSHVIDSPCATRPQGRRTDAAPIDAGCRRHHRRRAVVGIHQPSRLVHQVWKRPARTSGADGCTGSTRRGCCQCGSARCCVHQRSRCNIARNSAGVKYHIEPFTSMLTRSTARRTACCARCGGERRLPRPIACG